MISICIPTYEMHGRGAALLKRGFDSIKKQNYRDFEVVVADNSEDDVIKNLCENPEYASLNINYYRNPRKGMAQNTNASIEQAKGDLIKILYMDDYLADENSLKDIVDNFKGHWLVTGCAHDNGNGKPIKPHMPTYNKNIQLKNTIGSPSVLTIKNEDPIFFDETMTWMLDCDYYKRLYEKYGKPVIVDKVNVIIGLGEHQVTNQLTNERKRQELDYMKKKYKQSFF